MDPLAAQLLMTVQGTNLLMGIQSFAVDSAARTDAAAGGELQVYRSGSELRMRIYDSDAGAWREVALS